MNPVRRSICWSTWLALLALGMPFGCAPALPQNNAPDPLIRTVPTYQQVARPGVVSPVQFLQPEVLPELGNHVESVPVKELPISMETVFRLAADQNGQVAMGREKLNEALANQDVAANRWLPDVSGGTSYYRHEGGISDFYGNLINSSYGALFAGVELKGKLDLREATYRKVDAERQVWQQKGELSKLTAENLLDASSTYIDFLAAGTALTIADDMETKLGQLLTTTLKRAEIDEGFKVEVSRIKSELEGQRQIARKLRESKSGAAAKLAYLLGLPPESEFVPLERTMPELNRKYLVNPHEPVEKLVERAMEGGPGVRELAALLQVIDEARRQSLGLGTYVPTVEVTVAEGLFGTGSDGSLDFTNRFDLGVHLRWNLTEAATARAKKRQADSKISQAHLGYQELRAKLALGVREARESCLSNVDMMHMGQKQIENAEDAYKLSDFRLRNNVKGSSSSEVVQALRSYVGAKLNYLNAVREMDKAQMRLFVLVGAAAEK